MDIEYLKRISAESIRTRLAGAKIDFDKLFEIRLRINQKMLFRFRDKTAYLLESGGLCDYQNCRERIGQIKDAYKIQMRDIKETLEYISNFSLYAYEEEIKQGFITINGGHRVGISGKAVFDASSLRTIRNISSVNIRISHEIYGCADGLLKYAVAEGRVYNTMIISPPCGGKTTILRDLIRQISECGFNVSVIDERSELAASHMGIPQNNLGPNTDIMDCCPKAVGMIRMLRVMSPDVIAADEIGLEEDVNAIRYLCACGCAIVCTIHSDSYDELRCKPILGRMISEGIFERLIVLSGKENPGFVKEIYTGNGKRIL